MGLVASNLVLRISNEFATRLSARDVGDHAIGERDPNGDECVRRVLRAPHTLGQPGVTQQIAFSKEDGEEA